MLSIHNDQKVMMKNLQKDFDVLNSYLQKNELYISLSKTCFMPVTTSHMKIENYGIFAHSDDCRNKDLCDCKEIKKVNNAKYLGLEIDTNWKFSNT
jgi:hypothetical protein